MSGVAAIVIALLLRLHPAKRGLNCARQRNYRWHPAGAEDLRNAFERYGEIRDVYMPKDFHTGCARLLEHPSYEVLCRCCTMSSGLRK